MDIAAAAIDGHDEAGPYTQTLQKLSVAAVFPMRTWTFAFNAKQIVSDTLGPTGVNVYKLHSMFLYSATRPHKIHFTNFCRERRHLEIQLTSSELKCLEYIVLLL